MGDNIQNIKGKQWIEAENYEDKKSLKFPISLHHLSLMEYSSKWKLETIILFEKLVLMYRFADLAPFFYRQTSLMRELHITRDRLENARKILKEDGVLVEHNPGSGKLLRYTLKKEKIIELVPEIYCKPKKSTKSIETFNDEIRDFYSYYLSEKYLKNKIKKGKFDVFKSLNKSGGNNSVDNGGNIIYKID